MPEEESESPLKPEPVDASTFEKTIENLQHLIDTGTDSVASEEMGATLLRQLRKLWKEQSC